MWYHRIGLVVVALLLCTSMLGMQAGAHSPRFIKLTYEPETLSVIIIHPSFARPVHYVYKIDVEKNQALYTSEFYDTQPRFFINVYTFSVNATSGDEITVITYCSLFGKLSRSLILP